MSYTNSLLLPPWILCQFTIQSKILKRDWIVIILRLFKNYLVPVRIEISRSTVCKRSLFNINFCADTGGCSGRISIVQIDVRFTIIIEIKCSKMRKVNSKHWLLEFLTILPSHEVVPSKSFVKHFYALLPANFKNYPLINTGDIRIFSSEIRIRSEIISG